MKLCNLCKELKEYQEFWKNKNYGDGYYSQCKECKKQKLSIYYKRPDIQQKERERGRIRIRKKRGLPLDHPLLKAPNGSGCRVKDGYRVIRKKEHPNARVTGAIFEHVYLMSQHLGRPLAKNERIHHKNGIRDDNHIENLELWHIGQPTGQRVDDKIDWCKKFLEQYGYEVTKRERNNG